MPLRWVIKPINTLVGLLYVRSDTPLSIWGTCCVTSVGLYASRLWASVSVGLVWIFWAWERSGSWGDGWSKVWERMCICWVVRYLHDNSTNILILLENDAIESDGSHRNDLSLSTLILHASELFHRSLSASLSIDFLSRLFCCLPNGYLPCHRYTLGYSSWSALITLKDLPA